MVKYSKILSDMFSLVKQKKIKGTPTVTKLLWHVTPEAKFRKYFFTGNKEPLAGERNPV